jgi:RES domain-containing protein
MRVYRLSRKKYARDLTGDGARMTGGRWNSRGIPAIYTSESRALCALEVAVHLPLHLTPTDYCLITLEFHGKLVHTVDIDELPEDWRSVPHSDTTQKFGDRLLIRQRRLALRFPSAIVPEEHNVIINPRHRDLSKVSILDVENFPFDERLFA